MQSSDSIVWFPNMDRRHRIFQNFAAQDQIELAVCDPDATGSIKRLAAVSIECTMAHVCVS
jgi:hypothetical protein